MDTVYFIHPLLSPATLVVTILSGLGLGWFLSISRQYRGYFTSLLLSISVMLVIGWSFLLPLALERVLESPDNLPRWIATLLLWAVFAVTTVVNENIVTRRHR
jgi:hypothetical protein